MSGAETGGYFCRLEYHWPACKNGIIGSHVPGLAILISEYRKGLQHVRTSSTSCWAAQVERQRWMTRIQELANLDHRLPRFRQPGHKEDRGMGMPLLRWCEALLRDCATTVSSGKRLFEPFGILVRVESAAGCPMFPMQGVCRPVGGVAAHLYKCPGSQCQSGAVPSLIVIHTWSSP